LFFTPYLAGFVPGGGWLVTIAESNPQVGVSHPVNAR